MPKALNEEIGTALAESAEREGLGGASFLDKIADESVGTSEEEIMDFLTAKEHPAMTMDPMF